MGYTETKNMGNKRYLISLSVLMPYAPLREMKCNPQMFTIPVKAEEKQQVLPSYKEGEKSLFSSPTFKKKKKCIFLISGYAFSSLCFLRPNHLR